MLINSKLRTCILLLTLISCRPTPTVPGPAPAAAWPEVRLPDGAAVKVEYARTPEERAQGLMYRQSMAEDHGMLFVFDEAENQSFYMKNCFFAQDMLFLDAKGVVVDLTENFEPCADEPCRTYTSRQKALYVLELNAGQVKKHGIKVGAILKLPKP
jgi:uncharacterized protein